MSEATVPLSCTGCGVHIADIPEAMAFDPKLFDKVDGLLSAKGVITVSVDDKNGIDLPEVRAFCSRVCASTFHEAWQVREALRKLAPDPEPEFSSFGHRIAEDVEYDSDSDPSHYEDETPWP